MFVLPLVIFKISLHKHFYLLLESTLLILTIFENFLFQIGQICGPRTKKK